MNANFDLNQCPLIVIWETTQACDLACCHCRACAQPLRHPLELTTKESEKLIRDVADLRPPIFILTGGDPLILSPRRLRNVVRNLAAIDHVKIIRIHSRVPVVTPERVMRELVRAAKAKGKATYLVVHVNHARELTAEVRAACDKFIDAGIPVLSQTVLLRGVNDDEAALSDLMRALVETRIKPYYLHHADLAPGTAHLRTTIDEGQRLMRALRGRVSGLCQPTYVLDIPGGAGKVPIGPNYLHGKGTGGHFAVEDPSGCRHRYPPVNSPA